MYQSEPVQARAAVEWLCVQANNYKSRPQKFTPLEVAHAISGYAPTLGRVSSKIEAELILRGVKTEYLKIGQKRWFVLL